MKAATVRELIVIRRIIGFGIRAAGRLYVGYWAIFFGSLAFLIINSYLQEHGHHPAKKPTPHELHYDHKISKTWQGDE
jgi:hypothetical protein